MKTIINNKINHVSFVIDASGSMQSIRESVIKVFNNQIASMAKQSQHYQQDTRISVFLFNTVCDCLIFDRDVLRLPSLSTHYLPNGGTALIDSVINVLDDLAKINDLHNDGVHLVIILTDSEENQSKKLPGELERKIKELSDNYTVAAFVPNQMGVNYAKNAGFPKDNISVWNTTSDGTEEVGEKIQKATESFMKARATGVKSVKNLFNLDATNLTTTQVTQNLDQLSPDKYVLLPIPSNVKPKTQIKDFVSKWGIEYVQGSSYYTLLRPEKVQANKNICVQEKLTGKIYTGTNARKLIGLPDHEVKISPLSNDKYNIYIQSNSTNRHVFAGTNLLVMK